MWLLLMPVLKQLLEVMYEIRNDASYMIATEETTPLNGWDYNLFLNTFIAAAKTPINFVNSAVTAFGTSYSNSTGSNISGMDLSAINNVMTAFNAFSNALYNATTTDAIRSDILQTIYFDVENFFSIPGDLNIDLWDCADQIASQWNYADAEAAVLKNAIDNAVVAEWHNTTTGLTGNPRSHGIAVHLIHLDENGSPDGIDNAYCQGLSVSYPLSFVSDSAWVPVVPAGPGLLYRLWYEVLP